MDEPIVDPTAYQDRIVLNPNILVGKPTNKGTRISVELILHFLAYDPGLNELFEAYPRLTVEDVQAALAYARRLRRARAGLAPARACGKRPGRMISRPLLLDESAHRRPGPWLRSEGGEVTVVAIDYPRASTIERSWRSLTGRVGSW